MEKPFPRSTASETRHNAHETPANLGGRPCATCKHVERDLIEERLRAGEPLARVARAFRIGEAALTRHRDRHMQALPPDKAPPPPAPASGARLRDPVELIRDADPIAESDDLRLRAYALWARSMQRNDLPLALRATAELRAQLELSAKLRGKLNDQPVAVVVDSAELARKIEERLSRLAPSPRVIDVDSGQ